MKSQQAHSKLCHTVRSLLLRQCNYRDSSVDWALHQYCRRHGLKSDSSLTFIQDYFYNCSSCVYKCDSQSCVHLSPQFKYMIFHIFTCSLHHLQVYNYELKMWPAHSWLDVAQLVEHCTGICRGHEFESPPRLNFFPA